MPKLGKDDSESIATKVCSPIGRKWNATCPRKRLLLRFESNRTATSDGAARMLGNDVWHDSESIATKVCSQIGRKRNVTFESHARRAWIFDLKISKQSAFVNNHLLCYWPTILNSPSRSQRSVLNFMFSVLTFSRSMSCSMSIEQSCARCNYFNCNLCRMR